MDGTDLASIGNTGGSTGSFMRPSCPANNANIPRNMARGTAGDEKGRVRPGDLTGMKGP
jgi:hypothetical protein